MEYASKFVAWQKTIALYPKPIAWWDHRSEGLAKAKVKEVILHVADGEEDRLSLALSNGFPIYLDTSHLTNEDLKVVASIREKFRLVRCADSLFQLGLKAAKSSASVDVQ